MEREQIIVGFILFVIGGLMVARPDWYVRFQVWTQRVIMGAEWKPSGRTYMVFRIIGTILVILGLTNFVGGSILSSSYQKSESSRVQETDVVSYRTTLSGTYFDCLPKNDNLSTERCVPGMKADDGSYYAVDFNLMSQPRPVLKSGDRFTATGLMTPAEMLSGDQVRFAVGKGIFSVTDSVQKK